MANLSDAFGTIEVKKVGKEFLEYILKAQGDGANEAYYLLGFSECFKDAEVDENGDVVIQFSAGGRWSYESNLDGYLKGEWLNYSEDTEEGRNFREFLRVFLEKEGSIHVEYSDSETGCDFMGTGEYDMYCENGEIKYSSNFDGGPVTIKGFAELQGETESWALAYIYGDEVADKYEEYVEQWKKDHNFVEGKEEPASPSEWYDNEYQEE